MANSLITRCPKCSTAFRVSDDVLSMAKGKVRCGQCFHIFDATKTPHQQDAASKQTSPSKPSDVTPATPQIQVTEPQNPPRIAETTPQKIDEEIVNPDWLDTLFTDEDLHPTTEDSPSLPIEEQKQEEPAKKQKQEELAPWELELAEVEAALSAAPKKTDTKAQPQTPKNRPIIEEQAPAFDLDAELNANSAQLVENAPTNPTSEPDYMTALHSLAQTAAEQNRPSDAKNQHSILEQLSAQESLAPLLEDHEKSAPKKSRTGLWLIASLLGLVLLTVQVGIHFFDEGSRSANFRAIYQSLCSYTGCSLPGFEDIDAISIQHVRIQSHPSIPNTLLVNAIITNTSAFSQPMPKIALEFFDLNGLPVAARLFAPNDYLHKDFLDITYMPPNTPIHLVIPIQDPAARAVTHQLRAFPADTRSY